MGVFLNNKLQDLTVTNCTRLIKSSLESVLRCMIAYIDWLTFEENMLFVKRTVLISLKEGLFFVFLKICTGKYIVKIILLTCHMQDGFPPTVMLNDSYQNDWSNWVCWGKLCKE